MTTTRPKHAVLRELRDTEQRIAATKQELLDAREKDWVAEARKVHHLVFRKTFKVGGAWITNTQKEAQETTRVVSQLGRVRHLWGYLHPERGVHAAMDRRGPNSSIQGWGSDLGYQGGYFTRRLVWDFFTKHDVWFDYVQCNAVHDSTETEAAFAIIPIVEYLQHHGYTTYVHRWLRERFGSLPNIGLEMDAEIGASLSDLKKSGRPDNIVAAVKHGIEWGNKNLGWGYSDAEVERTLRAVEHNANVVHAIRRREIARQLERGDRAPTYMEMTAENWRRYKLYLPPKPREEQEHARPAEQLRARRVIRISEAA